MKLDVFRRGRLKLYKAYINGQIFKKDPELSRLPKEWRGCVGVLGAGIFVAVSLKGLVPGDWDERVIVVDNPN